MTVRGSKLLSSFMTKAPMVSMIASLVTPALAYHLLMRTVKILEPIAMRRRPSCRAAGACARTGLPLTDGEPPHVDRCECFVTREFAYEVLHIAGQLEILLKRGDRLAKMLDRSTARRINHRASAYPGEAMRKLGWWPGNTGNHRFSCSQSCQGFYLYGTARSVTRFTRRS